MADAPNPAPAAKNAAHNLARQLKNPKTLAIVGVLTIGFILYFRHRGANALNQPDASSTPTGQDATQYPDSTQGAVGGGGVDTTGSYGGSDQPQAVEQPPPDWYIVPPDWYNSPPNENGSTGAPVAPPPVTPTGGGPPTTDTGTHATPGKATARKPNTFLQHSGSHAGQAYRVVQKPSAAHGGQLWNFRDYGPGTKPVPIGPVKGSKPKPEAKAKPKRSRGTTTRRTASRRPAHHR